jgi:murein L,D-transpeptidase YafK
VMILRGFAVVSVLSLASLGTAHAASQHADRVVVEKAARRLSLLHGNQVLKTYAVALGGEPRGRKVCQGDNRTPEGTYVIDSRNRGSRYHRSLHVSYPNATDREAARQARCSPGGDIMVHGLPNGYAWLGRSHTLHDWTLGCIAVTNDEIEEIWRLVPNGTLIEIKP